nr:hypothetical protein CFP56_69889 [Quercus suber]
MSYYKATTRCFRSATTSDSTISASFVPNYCFHMYVLDHSSTIDVQNDGLAVCCYQRSATGDSTPMTTEPQKIVHAVTLDVLRQHQPHHAATHAS